MQYGPKRMSHFPTIWLNKTTIKNEPVGELRDSSFTYLPGFVVLCLEIVENIGQMHKSMFSF